MNTLHCLRTLQCMQPLQAHSLNMLLNEALLSKCADEVMTQNLVLGLGSCI